MTVDYALCRKRMVEEQLSPRGISDKRVLETFGKVPRHEFVADEFRDSSYGDYPLPTDDGQTISQPYMAALMTECLRPAPSDRILEIGTGSGYQAAILAELVSEVFSVERSARLAARAGDTLGRLGYGKVRIKVGDGTLGWEEHAPFNGIIVTAGAPDIPPSLINQMKEPGRLVIPIGGSFGQVLTLAEKTGGSIKTRDICACVFVPLIGKEGWRA